jgi:hypothetical protein
MAVSPSQEGVLQACKSVEGFMMPFVKKTRAEYDADDLRWKLAALAVLAEGTNALTLCQAPPPFRTILLQMLKAGQVWQKD